MPLQGESESVIMIGVADRRDEWVGPSSRPERLRASLRLEKANPQRERNGALHGVHAVVRFEKNLTPPTLSEKRFIANYPRPPKNHDSVNSLERSHALESHDAYRHHVRYS